MLCTGKAADFLFDCLVQMVCNFTNFLSFSRLLSGLSSAPFMVPFPLKVMECAYCVRISSVQHNTIFFGPSMKF